MEYRVIRSSRRTLALELTPAGEVLVRAPFAVSERDVQAFFEGHRAWVERRLPALRERLAPPLTKEEETALRQRAKEDLPQRTARWATRMGITYGSVRITSARRRLGSCSSLGNLSFSFRLMAHPEEIIDYVVVHELAHRKQMNHSQEFYKLVARYLPDYRQRIALLRTLPILQ
ncbi:MAG: M48 family metallopeptidase [Clostridia bacterium]|nr:M48 family metallopeptidase [Clostridia bacterium]